MDRLLGMERARERVCALFTDNKSQVINLRRPGGASARNTLLLLRMAEDTSSLFPGCLTAGPALGLQPFEGGGVGGVVI